jgi:hypothetical protein
VKEKKKWPFGIKVVYGMYFFGSLWILIYLNACNDNYEPKPVYKIPTSNMTELKYSVFNIDGCQYLLYEMMDGKGLTHKGDCTNAVGHKIFN